ncbi:TPA: hypothetical protein ACJG76_002893 [Salmonella enterica subsp. diarizonae serovar 61:i:z]
MFNIKLEVAHSSGYAQQRNDKHFRLNRSTGLRYGVAFLLTKIAGQSGEIMYKVKVSYILPEGEQARVVSTTV